MMMGGPACSREQSATILHTIMNNLSQHFMNIWPCPADLFNLTVGDVTTNQMVHPSQCSHLIGPDNLPVGDVTTNQMVHPHPPPPSEVI